MSHYLPIAPWQWHIPTAFLMVQVHLRVYVQCSVPAVAHFIRVSIPLCRLKPTLYLLSGDSFSAGGFIIIIYHFCRKQLLWGEKFVPLAHTDVFKEVTVTVTEMLRETAPFQNRWTFQFPQTPFDIHVQIVNNWVASMKDSLLVWWR